MTLELDAIFEKVPKQLCLSSNRQEISADKKEVIITFFEWYALSDYHDFLESPSRLLELESGFFS
ncbi:hypothetical protein GCM10009597_05150 [Peribacillus frigoritolerans]